MRRRRGDVERRAGEEVLGGVRGAVAERAEVGVIGVEAVEVGVEAGAEAGAKLGEAGLFPAGDVDAVNRGVGLGVEDG